MLTGDLCIIRNNKLGNIYSKGPIFCKKRTINFRVTRADTFHLKIIEHDVTYIRAMFYYESNLN